MSQLYGDFFFPIVRDIIATCGCCGGSGTLRVLRRFWWARKEKCPMCNGHGRVRVPA